MVNRASVSFLCLAFIWFLPRWGIRPCLYLQTCTDHPNTKAAPCPAPSASKTHTQASNVAWQPSSCSSKRFNGTLQRGWTKMCGYSVACCSNYILVVTEEKGGLSCAHKHTHTDTQTHQLQWAYHQQRASAVALPHLGGLGTRLGATEAPGKWRVPGQIQTAWSCGLTPFPAE